MSGEIHGQIHLRNPSWFEQKGDGKNSDSQACCLASATGGGTLEAFMSFGARHTFKSFDHGSGPACDDSFLATLMDQRPQPRKGCSFYDIACESGFKICFTLCVYRSDHTQVIGA